MLAFLKSLLTKPASQAPAKKHLRMETVYGAGKIPDILASSPLGEEHKKIPQSECSIRSKSY